MAFNRAAAAAYARNWANGTNPAFPRFENDCASFVSQVMQAGGWTMVGNRNCLNRQSDNVWWYGGSLLTRASYSWAGAHNFSKFIKASGRGTEVTDFRMLDRGDIVQLKREDGQVYHTMAVTENIGGDLLLCYHTRDEYDKRLSIILTGLGAYAPIYWKVSDTVL